MVSHFFFALQFNWKSFVRRSYFLFSKTPNLKGVFMERIIESVRIRRSALPARSPNLNPFAERWVRSIKVSFESNPIWGEFSSASDQWIHQAQPSGERSPRQGQCIASSLDWGGAEETVSYSMSRKAGWSPKILSSRGRMIFFTIRESSLRRAPKTFLRPDARHAPFDHRRTGDGHAALK